MQIRHPIRGADKVQTFLKTVPRGTIRTALFAIAEYIVGDSNHGLAHDDPYRQTTRKAVYGQTFESDKQRRYVMAKIRSGEIKIGQRQHSPTDASSGYGHKETNSGYGQTIFNEKPGAYWGRKWGGWKSWRTVEKVVADNIAGALRHAGAAIKEWMRSNAK